MTMTAVRRPALPKLLVNAIADRDLPRRLRLCQAVSEAVWAYGFRACRDDAERDQWVVGHADWLNNQLDEPWRAPSGFSVLA